MAHWRIFQDIERNLYEPNGTAGHGFHGWLNTSQANSGWLPTNTAGSDILRSIVALTEPGGKAAAANLTSEQLVDLLRRDIIGLGVEKHPLGAFDLVTHADNQGLRSSPADYIRKTINDPKGYPLTLELDAFVTSLEWDPLVAPGQKPTVMGINYLVGKSIYQADPRYNASSKPVRRHAYVGKEVIIAGGTFNSPQILKVSGVGPAEELKKFNISVVADVPGVGRNLGDNYEGAVVSQAANTPDNFGGTYAVYLNTSQSEGPRDIFMW